MITKITDKKDRALLGGRTEDPAPFVEKGKQITEANYCIDRINTLSRNGHFSTLLNNDSEKDQTGPSRNSTSLNITGSKKRHFKIGVTKTPLFSFFTFFIDIYRIKTESILEKEFEGRLPEQLLFNDTDFWKDDYKILSNFEMNGGDRFGVC